MELKKYQRQVLTDLQNYLDELKYCDTLDAAWEHYWAEREIKIDDGAAPRYKDSIQGVPNICMKVPTGGGKTYLACASLKKIFDALPFGRPKFALWLVPSDAIYAQTVRNLSDPRHPYRALLDRDFGGRVSIYTKDALLYGQDFSPDTVRERVSICVLSFASLRIDMKKKDIRKIYQDNGNLLGFQSAFGGGAELLLPNTPETALVQAIRQLEPVCIVDESHNAGSELSLEMLKNVNTSFILNLTATPREGSNVISYVSAKDLKSENMVKLPVIVYRRNTKNDVIYDALMLRGKLEEAAEAERAAGGEYIRPIVLFQAESKAGEKEDRETFEKVKAALMGIGISEDEIKIKTAGIDELKGIDLMSDSCPVRYIITVNALKEGWDCPFAYILAGLSNKNSNVDVEQIVGRILRQPHAKRCKENVLNTSYVLTASADFHKTLDSVVEGLNRSGFSKKDYRAPQLDVGAADSSESLFGGDGAEAGIDETAQVDVTDLTIAERGEQIGMKGGLQALAEAGDHAGGGKESEDLADEIDTEGLKNALETGHHKTNGSGSVSYTDILKQAVDEDKAYIGENDSVLRKYMENDSVDTSGVVKGKYAVQEEYREDAENTKMPQFFVQRAHDLFGGGFELLESEGLLEGFSLGGQDARVDFSFPEGETYKVDVENGPKYMKLLSRENEYFKTYLARLPEEKQLNACIERICSAVGKDDSISAREIKDYVGRIISAMNSDEVSSMALNPESYARKISEKIKELKEEHKREQFKKWLDTGKIICRSEYNIPAAIYLAESSDKVPKALYDAEADNLNDFEMKLLDNIAAAENVLWWHRIIERKDGEFKLNGPINHYPDFVVKTKSGRMLLVEAKGDDRDNSDSRAKLSLGRRWQEKAGEGYRYFMVFDKNKPDWDGAYGIDEFVTVLREL